MSAQISQAKKVEASERTVGPSFLLSVKGIDGKRILYTQFLPSDTVGKVWQLVVNKLGTDPVSMKMLHKDNVFTVVDSTLTFRESGIFAHPELTCIIAPREAQLDKLSVRMGQLAPNEAQLNQLSVRMSELAVPEAHVTPSSVPLGNFGDHSLATTKRESGYASSSGRTQSSNLPQHALPRGLIRNSSEDNYQGSRVISIMPQGFHEANEPPPGLVCSTWNASAYEFRPRRVVSIMSRVGWFVDRVGFKMSDGSEQSFCLEGTEISDGGFDQELQWLSHDEYIVRVEQHNHQVGYLGSALIFGLSSGREIRVAGEYGNKKIKNSKEFDAPLGNHIQSLAFQDSVLVDISYSLM